MLEFVKTDVEEIKREVVSVAEDVLNETLFPGDERYMMLMVLSLVFFSLRQEINVACNSNLLDHSFGNRLAALAKLRSNELKRLPAQKATVMTRFTLSAAQTSNVVIPVGTRVSPDGKLFFATVKTTTIPAGETERSVLAEATETGCDHDGFLPGQIKTIVDPVPFVAKAENIEISAGGSEIETDDAFRERIHTAPEGLSTAGPEAGYEYWVRSADGNVIDVKIDSPDPVVIDITVLLRDNEPLTTQIVEKIQNVLKKKRPMTDLVNIMTPKEAYFDINVTYYIKNGQQSKETEIKEAVDKAVEEYISWQTSELGLPILPEELVAKMKGAGAYRIDLMTPKFAALSRKEIARLRGMSVRCGGVFS